jgi:hypothetical protein
MGPLPGRICHATTAAPARQASRAGSFRWRHESGGSDGVTPLHRVWSRRGPSGHAACHRTPQVKAQGGMTPRGFQGRRPVPHASGRAGRDSPSRQRRTQHNTVGTSGREPPMGRPMRRRSTSRRAEAAPAHHAGLFLKVFPGWPQTGYVSRRGAVMAATRWRHIERLSRTRGPAPASD